MVGRCSWRLALPSQALRLNANRNADDSVQNAKARLLLGESMSRLQVLEVGGIAWHGSEALLE